MLLQPPPPRSTLFPYTTLFRSRAASRSREQAPAPGARTTPHRSPRAPGAGDRKSTRLNSSHVETSYAVFCLKKKNNDATPFNQILKQKTKREMRCSL